MVAQAFEAMDDPFDLSELAGHGTRVIDLDDEKPLTRTSSCINQLHHAAVQSELDTVRAMIKDGASVNAPIMCDDPGGDIFVTLLHVLCSRPDLPRCTDVIMEVVRSRASVNARSFLGSTPLACACLHKHMCAAELLLELGADPKPIDDRGRNALYCAVSLELDATPTAAPLSVESVSGNLVSLLASKCADVDNSDGVAPLLTAIQHSNRPAVVQLIKHGAKPYYLHVAVDNAPVAIIEDLLKGQADPFEEDRDGKSVLDIAFRRGDEDITTLLRDFIGDLERQHAKKMVKERAHSPMTPPRAASPPLIRSESENGPLGLSGLSSSDHSAKNRTSGKRHSISLSGSLSADFWRKKRPKRKSTTKVHAHQTQCRKFFDEHFPKVQVASRRVNRNRYFQLIMLASLFVVLFFPDMWVLCDMETNDALDAILIVVLVLFVFELLVQTIGTPRTYINSFFFWMDVVGLLSVPLDHSMVSQSMPQGLDNTVVMRAARMAKLGARAGRFTKLVKLLRFLPGVHQDTFSNGGQYDTAKNMSNTLMTSLSTRVSCLIILMVMVLPLFEMVTYPVDNSMKTWLTSLELTLETLGAAAFESRILRFEEFYDNKDYFPFRVHWRHGNGTSASMRLRGKRPRRALNQLDISSRSGDVTATFSFTTKNQVDALCNMLLIIVIIVLMVGFSLLLSNSVSGIVLRPLEKVLTGVKEMASKIFRSVSTMAATCTHTKSNTQNNIGDHHDDVDEIGDETEVLKRIIDKLTALSAITMQASPMDAATLEQLGQNDHAVVVREPNADDPSFKGGRCTQVSVDSSGVHSSQSISSNKQVDHAEELVQTIERLLEDASLDWNVLESWEFNALGIQQQQRHQMCLCVMIFNLSTFYAGKDKQCLSTFIEAVAGTYGSPAKVPYHNWHHAVDVTHCVFRLLNLCAADTFLSTHERYALIVSAVCHDMGHPGFNNPFLLETAHELAIRYNDHSPLENMHCAKLFEIVSQPKTCAFGMFDKQKYREVRQTCIDAILHTDNIHHFAMVKELQMLYEVNSDMFDITLQMYSTGQIESAPREIVDIFTEPEAKKLIKKLFLHFGDVSNAMKPFAICKRWAWLIIDEFFLQGDKEKELGITVQPLNDRDKVNKPYSQVGFIEFFVAPFSFAAVRLLPSFIPCTDQLMLNLHAWCDEWSGTHPIPEQGELAKLMERVSKLESKFIFREGF